MRALCVGEKGHRERDTARERDREGTRQREKHTQKERAGERLPVAASAASVDNTVVSGAWLGTERKDIEGEIQRVCV